MKAIMMSIKPEWVAKILNGEKTIEIRKKFPKDYVGWVYIYCTKGEDRLVWDIDGHICIDNEHYAYGDEELNGKVVGRFWCDNVEEIKLPYTKFGTNEWVGGECERTLQTETMDEETLLEKSCLSETEIYKYLNFKHSPNYCGCAIHITKVEPFDKPKEISELYTTRLDQDIIKLFDNSIQLEDGTWVKSLNRAPQSWCYIYGQKNKNKKS